MRPIRVESAKSEMRATVAHALATALVTGIDQAAQEQRPLTQLQQIDLATMHVMAYDEALKACESLDFEADTLGPLAEGLSDATAVAVAGSAGRT